MTRKFRNIWAFYQSTVLINLAVSVSAALLGGMASFAGSFLAFGFVLALVVKEVNAKPEYVFYRNNGLSRARLWAFGYAINAVVFVFLISIFTLCGRMF